MFLALREIRHQPGRFALIILIIALVSYVTFFLAALAVGLAHSYRAAIDSWNAQTVVLTEASNGNTAASRLSQDQVEQIRSAAQLSQAQAHALTIQGTVIERVDAQGQPLSADGAVVSRADRLRSDAYALGLELSGPLAPGVSQGSPITDPGTEVLLDDSLAKEGWKVGDHLRFSGTDTVWRVVGLTHDQTFQASGTVTVDGEALRAAARSALAPAVNAVVVTSPTGHAGVLEELSRSLPAGNLTVLSPAEFINSLPGYTAQVLTFSLMIGALILIAALVLGIFLYVLTLQKRPVLGILKARGVPTAFLIVSGGVQTAVLAATGVLTGLVLTLLSGLVLPEAVPFRLDPLLDAAVTGAFVVVAVLAGLMSVRLVTHIDPVEAIA